MWKVERRGGRMWVPCVYLSQRRGAIAHSEQMHVLQGLCFSPLYL